mgnify:FL=1
MCFGVGGHFHLLFSSLNSCKVDPEITDGTLNGWVYAPQSYELNIPQGLPPVLPSSENPMTVQGVELGRMLFFDPILSGDSSLSCAGCHAPEFAFTDSEKQFSVGIDGIEGTRNSMPIFNMIYHPGQMFWDGRASSLEDQALRPIEDPIEMHETLPNVLDKLRRHDEYPRLFYEAFGEGMITTDLIAKAITQFENSIISGNSRFDRAMRGEIFLTDDEVDGQIIFNDQMKGDCFHCHGINGGLFSDFTFRNNGLDAATKYSDFIDPGLGSVTLDTNDYGKFKVPTLRNIELTAPYMHDGRFETLEEVIDFYSEGVQAGPFTDPFMEFAHQDGVQLTDDEKQKLLAFLKSLTDTTFINDPAYQNPF